VALRAAQRGPAQLEDARLATAKQTLQVTDDQYRAIWAFIRDLRAVRLRGRNDATAAQATRDAAARLAASASLSPRSTSRAR
jgi:hypothetical protein